MKEEILNLIRKDIEEQKRKQSEYKKIIERLSKLEQNEVVKEYLGLIEELENNNCYNAQNMTEEAMIEKSYSKYRYENKDTNGLIVCLGSYAKCNKNSKCNRSEDSIVSSSSEKADYKVYVDIEKPLESSIIVAISECEQYEKENGIVDSGYVSDFNFYKLQREFLKEAIKTSQEEACNKIKEKQLSNKGIYN